VKSSNNIQLHARSDRAVIPRPEGAIVWIRAKALADRWGCSRSQVSRICARHAVRRCILGGTGMQGAAAANAMVLFSLEDILKIEKDSTV